MIANLDNWLALFSHFLSLSLLAVGGAITTAPDMQRYLVGEQGWLTDAQFNASIAISQAAPGPNVLFVALLGWNVGIGAAASLPGVHAWWIGLFGAMLTMVAVMLPSSILTYSATQWAHRNRHLRVVRAFKSGLAPIVIALLIATGYLITSTHNHLATDWPLWLLTLASTVIVWRTRIHLLWLLGAGALLGALGLV